MRYIDRMTLSEINLSFRFGTLMSNFTVSKIHWEAHLLISILTHIQGLPKNVVEHGWMRLFPAVVLWHVMELQLDCL